MKVFQILLSFRESFNGFQTEHRREKMFIVPADSCVEACEWLLGEFQFHGTCQAGAEIKSTVAIEGALACPEIPHPFIPTANSK